MKYPKLFEETNLGRLRLKNRIVLSPMNTRLPEGDGKVFNRAQEEFFAARAKGGAGLIITGQVKIEDIIDPFPVITVYPVIDSDTKIKEIARIADRVHLYGTKIIAQLNLGGGRQADFLSPEHIPVGPSENPVLGHPEIFTKELTVEEISLLVDCFGRAAGRLWRAGFDGVYFHTNGYLLDQFMTARWNRRTDKYGGSLSDRMQIFREMLASVEAYAGPDFVKMVGLVLDEGTPDGRTFEETIDIARMIETIGVDAFHVRVGSYSNLELSLPSYHFPDGTALAAAKRFRGEVSTPVIVDGKLSTPALCEAALQEGQADLIGIARPFIADSQWVNKAKSGDEEDIRPCLYCMQCSEALLQKRYLACSVNPALGWEVYPPASTGKAKVVAVIGGGPAGMEFAVTAKQRGFSVHLFEREPVLGGKLRAASVPDYKYQIARYIQWQERRLISAGVTVHLDAKDAVLSIKKLRPDVVVSAVGAIPMELPVPGIEYAKDALAVLRGDEETGARVAVIGGGLIGCEVAYVLAKMGKQVRVVEMLDQPLLSESVFTRNTMLKELEGLGVVFSLGSRVSRLYYDGLDVATASGDRRIKADTIVIAAGMRPDESLKAVISELAPEVYWIGDAKSVGKIIHAVSEGYRLACEI